MRKRFIAVSCAAILFASAAAPLRLMGERARLVRHGVMVDESVCESAAARADWETFESGNFTVYAEKGIDLYGVERGLRKRLFFLGQGRALGRDAEAQIAHRLDIICGRVMEVLDVRPRLPEIDIKIYANRADVIATYHALTGKAGEPRAFYAHDCRTIYTSADEITDSVMAHEIAHAVIDAHYNGVPPPEVSEMLASYVDMHVGD